MSRYVKARRAYSMPTRYALPSEEMGEYEDGRRRSAPQQRPNSAQAHALYPLSEEGTYGQPPAAPQKAVQKPPSGVPFQRIRERKPKTYSSYAVNSDCNVHGRKSSTDSGPNWASRSRRTSASPARRISSSSRERPSSRAGSRSRNPSSDRGVSAEPVASSRTTTTTRKYSAPARTPGYSSSSWSTSSSRTSNSNRTSQPQRRRSSSYNRYNGPLDESFEETEEYTYEENNNMNTVNNMMRKLSTKNNYSAFGKDIDYKSSKDGLSLGGLKKPQINSWDSMGILGLSSKMFSDSTNKRYDYFAREDSYNYNIM